MDTLLKLTLHLALSVLIQIVQNVLVLTLENAQNAFLDMVGTELTVLNVLIISVLNVVMPTRGHVLLVKLITICLTQMGIASGVLMGNIQLLALPLTLNASIVKTINA